MSADNWAICPQCSARDPFMGNDMNAHTLREDWEIGIDRDGEFTVHYRGGCRECGFTFRFEHSERTAKETK